MKSISNLKLPCPICNQDTFALDVVDLNKSCAESWGHFLPLSGRPTYYFQCPNCQFTFAPEFREWSDQDFLDHIYNEQYIEHDPEYIKDRPQNSFNMIHSLYGIYKHQIRHLDYGGGNGALSRLLNQEGWTSQSYDPFPVSTQEIGQLGHFNLITAFEVFEHVPDPDSLMKNLVSLMADDAVVLFSTLVSDNQIAPNARLTWWYASPRNGHISLFSKKSLILLGNRYGLHYASNNNNLHCFFKQPPSWFGEFINKTS